MWHSNFILESAPGGSNFNSLVDNIMQLRSVPLASQLFQFFDQTTFLDDLSDGHKQRIIDTTFPLLSIHIKRFDQELTEFNNKLMAHRKTPDIEVNIVSRAYTESITELENLLQGETVKEFIAGQFKDESLYEYRKFGSMRIKGFKSGIWTEFTPKMLDDEYLFDEYLEIMHNLKDHVAQAIYEYTNNYADPILVTDIDYFPSPKQSLKALFDESRWEEFIEICNYYCEVREFKKHTGKKIYAKVISRSKQNGFKWEGIGGSKIPVLAEFMTQLFNESFFSIPRNRIDVCRAFLKFFGLRADMSDQKQLCRDFQQIKQYHLYFDFQDRTTK